MPNNFYDRVTLHIWEHTLNIKERRPNRKIFEILCRHWRSLTGSSLVHYQLNFMHWGWKTFLLSRWTMSPSRFSSWRRCWGTFQHVQRYRVLSFWTVGQLVVDQTMPLFSVIRKYIPLFPVIPQSLPLCLSHAGDNQSDLNTLINPCAEPEVGPSEASTSSVLDKSRSDKMDSPLHTPCLIDSDCDITIETMVIPETQLDTSTSDFLASVPTGIMPSTPVERCVSRGSR